MKRLYKALCPILFSMDPERAHDLAMFSLKFSQKTPFIPSIIEKIFCLKTDPVELMGLKFKNPVGLAAGFDKNGEIAYILSKMGFGFIEIGTATLNPQPGNPKPRIFREKKETAIINKMGFNNSGAKKISENLKKTKKPEIPLGINIGKNTDCALENASENYAKSIEILHPFADYIGLNISCPNIKDLKTFHKTEEFEKFLTPIVRLKKAENIQKPFFIKISPDIENREIENIVGLAEKYSMGLIATNTIDSKSLNSPFIKHSGAVSGKPLEEKANEILKKIRKLSSKIPLIASGGVYCAESALRKLDLGANLVQIYTGFIYEGPFFAKDLIRYMCEKK